MKKALSILFISGFLLAGCGAQEVQNDTEPVADKPMEQAQTQTSTLSEIAKHDNQDDCWLLIDGKVYDVTDFVGNHPGGEAILEGCGIDSTELYETRPMGSGTPHSDSAREGLENFYIGDLEG